VREDKNTTRDTIQKTMVDREQFKIADDGLLVSAPAKINLSLLIAGRRPDGFHEVETIMAKIDYYDELLIQKGKKSGIELRCKGRHWAPAGKENLIYQACEMLLDCCRVKANLRLTLTKNIPAGTGLGSASSDAAATLMGLNRLLKLGVGKRRLSEIAAKLGSDIAFFLGGPLAFCTGKGEKIKKLNKIFDFSALLILPDVTISTKTVYDNYKHNNDLYKRLSAQIKSLLLKNRIDLVSKMCANVLQTTCLGLCEGLADLKTSAESLGFRPLCLSGSGSAMFYIADGINEKITLEDRSELENKNRCKSIIVRNNRW